MKITPSYRRTQHVPDSSIVLLWPDGDRRHAFDTAYHELEGVIGIKAARERMVDMAQRYGAAIARDGRTQER